MIFILEWVRYQPFSIVEELRMVIEADGSFYLDYEISGNLETNVYIDGSMGSRNGSMCIYLFC